MVNNDLSFFKRELLKECNNDDFDLNDFIRLKSYDIIKYSNLFDEEFYFINFPDVKFKSLDPIEHYLNLGFLENCNPNSTFNTGEYLNNHPSLKKADINPFVHYILCEILNIDLEETYKIYNQNTTSKNNSLRISQYNDFTKKWDLMYNYLLIDCLFKENEVLKSKLDNLNSVDFINYDDLTFIIPYRESEDSIRKENLIHVLNYLSFIGIKNVIISEEDSYQKTQFLLNEYSDKFNFFKIVFTKSNELFNRAVAINNGVLASKTSYIVISDSDVLLPKNIYDNAFSLIKKDYDFVFPFNRSVTQISFDIREKFLKSYDFDCLTSKMEFRSNADGGLIFCKKKSFLNIGGYDPTFVGWGCEDNAFLIKINMSNFDIIRLDNTLYHLYHEKAKNAGGSNSQILENVYNLSKLNNMDLLINQNKEMFYLMHNKNDDLINLDLEFKHSDNYLVSVIMPVYNAVDFYLERSLNSLMNQTIGFENIEVVIVDDGSKYNHSKEIIRKYANKYPNIKAIFSEVNSGSGTARNIGIENANADYIMFLDYDDYFLDTACDVLYYSIENENVDLVISNYINLSRDNFKKVDWTPRGISKYKTYLNNFEDLISIFQIDPFIATKIYKKSFLKDKNIKFKKHRLGQDLVFNHTTLFNAKGIILIDEPVVVYKLREENSQDTSSVSICNKKECLISLLNVYEDIYNLFKEFSPKNIRIALGYLNYWVSRRLLYSNVDFNELKIIIDEGYYLFEKALNCDDLWINNDFKILYDYFSNKKYDLAYAVYKELKN